MALRAAPRPAASAVDGPDAAVAHRLPELRSGGAGAGRRTDRGRGTERRRQDEPARGDPRRDHRPLASRRRRRRAGAPRCRLRSSACSSSRGGTAAGGATIELVLPGATPPAGRAQAPDRQRGCRGAARRWRRRPARSSSGRRRCCSSSARRRTGAASWTASSPSATARAARDLADAARILAQRNALLRAIRAEEAELDALGFWDEQLAQVGARVMRARLEVVREIGERIGPLHDAVAAPPERGASVTLAYVDGLKEAWPERADPSVRMPEAEELVAALPACGSPRSASARRGTG